MASLTYPLAFTPSAFFAFRTPLLPFDELLAWSDGLESATNANEASFASDRKLLRERLRNAIQRPEVRDALFVASPDLDGRFDVWLREPDSEAGRKMERALVRYFQRMAGRATPFGLFAGCSVGAIGRETRLEVDGRDKYQRHTRLDMEYLVALAEAIEQQPTVRESLTYRPNSTLYRAGGRLRYVEYRRDCKLRSYRVVGIEDSEAIRQVLTCAAHGAKPTELAAALLESDPEATVEEAEEFVRELIASQILVSDLAPAVTGPEPIHGLIDRLGQHEAREAADRLEQAAAALGAIDDQGPGAARERYRAVARILGELPAKVEPGRLFQVDMTKPAPSACLSAAVTEEILRGVDLLRRLAPTPVEDDLTRFRKAFIDRYQGDDASEQNARWVPLLEALDEEIGIGLGNADGRGAQGAGLLEDLPFAQAAGGNIPWGKRETFLLRKLSDALGRGDMEIVLGPRDLEELTNPDPLPAPDAVAAMATLAARSEEAVTRGDYRVLLEGVSGPSGASMLGRFCHADPNLLQQVEEHLRAEEQLDPEAIFAEIAHLPPEERVGNVILRPALREYEIVYAGNSGAATERQIPVTDLQVAVVGNRVVLRSPRLGRRVIPRLTSAHNFSGRGQGVYRFLCLLQAQGNSRLGWDWGPLRNAPFLPRVVSGRVVLACARWLVGKEELQAFAAKRGTERFRTIQGWRAERRLPRWLLLSDGDNDMPVDLDNVLSVETFVEMAKGRDQIALVEMFPSPDELCARGPEGHFVHELIVPFVRHVNSDAKRPVDKSKPHVSSAVCRSFPPGSEWFYAKLYTGPATADEVLRDVVRPVVDAALNSGAADGWFFIRYGDPEWHVRLRFHGNPTRLREEVWPLLQAAVAPLVADSRVWRVQLDTYEREVERYGGPHGIELGERLFEADSEAILAIVDRLAEDPAGDLRWRLALVGMNRLLDEFGFDLAQKHAVVRRARDSFAKEFRADADLKKRLAEKYRGHRSDLEQILDPNRNPDGLIANVLAAFTANSQAITAAAAKLRAADRAGRLSLSLSELAPSYLHMHANRMLRSAHRAQELLLYDFLDRYNQSQIARRPARQKLIDMHEAC
jgi:thiopeptide-type bacteriocin biosynthesis protein